MLPFIPQRDEEGGRVRERELHQAGEEGVIIHGMVWWECLRLLEGKQVQGSGRAMCFQTQAHSM